MKRHISLLAGLLLALAASGAAQARHDDLDVARLNDSLSQLANDPTLGLYAQAEQSLARDAINQLAQAGSRERPHALYIAERRVDQAKAAAQLQDAQMRLNQVEREHDQLQLDRSRIDAQAAQQELEFQRAQYQLAQQRAALLQQQGEEAASQADQARAEADQARKLAAAQSRVAKAAKREAELAAQAARAMRSQMQNSGTSKSGGQDGGNP